MIIFGPAGLGPVKTAEKVLEECNKLGLKACEIAFTYSVYIKPDDALRIGKKAKELGINLILGGHRETEKYGAREMAHTFV
jgi:putative NIF3 family GTP cyclohydrolase 1 type 2